LQRLTDSSGDETTAWRCDLRPDWLRVDDEDNDEWKRDKEKEGDSVCKDNRDDERQYQEDTDEIIFTSFAVIY
jgi:hypothetical protein